MSPQTRQKLAARSCHTHPPRRQKYRAARAFHLILIVAGVFVAWSFLIHGQTHPGSVLAQRVLSERDGTMFADSSNTNKDVCNDLEVRGYSVY